MDWDFILVAEHIPIPISLVMQDRKEIDGNSSLKKDYFKDLLEEIEEIVKNWTYIERICKNQYKRFSKKSYLISLKKEKVGMYMRKEKLKIEFDTIRGIIPGKKERSIQYFYISIIPRVCIRTYISNQKCIHE